jgi:hypothetical protein
MTSVLHRSAFRLGGGVALLATTFFGFPVERAAAAVPPCASLASTLSGDPNVKSATSSINPAAGPNAPYCAVHLVYGETPEQNIRIFVALPLSAADGGSGRLQGAWNGRTQGLGGGGCSGVSSFNSLAGTANQGYVASGTDTGHAGGNCEPGVNPDGTYNLGFINDFIRVSLKKQILYSKAIAATYYGLNAAYNYWNGCSTGGRQGYVLAQELGDELDGIMASAPAIYWTRFQTSQMWGQIVMRELIGKHTVRQTQSDHHISRQCLRRC